MILDITCDDLSPFLGILKNGIFPIIQFAVPIILIVLGTIDLVKATASGDDKVTKEATSDFLRRIIYGIGVFFVPILVNLVFGMFAETGDSELESIDFFACWEMVSNVSVNEGTASCYPNSCSSGMKCKNSLTMNNCNSANEECSCVNNSFVFEQGSYNCYNVIYENASGYDIPTALDVNTMMCCPINIDKGEFYTTDSCMNPNQ